MLSIYVITRLSISRRYFDTITDISLHYAYIYVVISLPCQLVSLHSLIKLIEPWDARRNKLYSKHFPPRYARFSHGISRKILFYYGISLLDTFHIRDIASFWHSFTLVIRFIMIYCITYLFFNGRSHHFASPLIAWYKALKIFRLPRNIILARLWFYGYNIVSSIDWQDIRKMASVAYTAR